MRALIDRHIDAEGRNDIDAAVAVYTDDVDQDVVGFPDGHSLGKDEAMILKQEMTGTVVGSMLGLPGNDRRVTFRMLHIFEFRDGLINCENVWLESAAVIDQLS